MPPLNLARVHTIETRHRMDQAEVSAISRLVLAVSQADGHAPLGEHNWLDLVHGGREGQVAVLAKSQQTGQLIGYAQVSRGGGSWALEYSVHPRHRSPGSRIGSDLVRAALDHISRAGGGHVHLWVAKPDREADLVAAGNGLTRGRDLLQLRRKLPAPPPAEAIKLRPFRPGQDESDWLDLNNRAFAWHPEQGGWDRETLARRQAESWFDPEGFLLAEGESGHLAGFCWTKVHEDHEPPLGEIYVVAVAPEARGKGLGRSLVLSGLDLLARRGLGVAMLYVDASNAAARKLYDELGFSLDHVDRAYVGDVEPLVGRRPEPDLPVTDEGGPGEKP